MQQALTYGFYIALAGVFVILVMGIVNLARTDDEATSRSNKLMRLRVLLQFVAVMMLVGLGFVTGTIQMPG